MEIVNWSAEDKRDRHSMLAWAIISLITEAGQSDPEAEAKLSAPAADAKRLEIECRINGVEVSLVKLLARLESEYKRQIVVDTQKLAEEQFSGLYSTLDDCRRKLREILKLGEE